MKLHFANTNTSTEGLFDAFKRKEQPQQHTAKERLLKVSYNDQPLTIKDVEKLIASFNMLMQKVLSVISSRGKGNVSFELLDSYKYEKSELLDAYADSNYIEPCLHITGNGLFDWKWVNFHKIYPNFPEDGAGIQHLNNVYNEILKSLDGVAGWSLIDGYSIFQEDALWDYHKDPDGTPNMLVQKRGGKILATCGITYDHKYRDNNLSMLIFTSNPNELDGSQESLGGALENLKDIVATLHQFDSKKEILALVRKDPVMDDLLNGLDDETCVAKLEGVLEAALA